MTGEETLTPGKREDFGLALYLGAPHQGKTYLATAHAQASGRPVLVVDGGGVCRWPARAVTPFVDVFHRLYALRESVRWFPRDETAFVALFRGLTAAQERLRVPIEILVDECAPWMSAQACPEELAFLVRVQAHYRITFRWTTQCPQDVWKRARNMASAVYAFRNDDEAALAALAQWGFDADQVQRLQPREFVEWRRG